jgi:hypothetical protein
MAAAYEHPYYPQDLKLNGWQPLALPFQQILATFFGACGLVLTAGWWLTSACRARAQRLSAASSSALDRVLAQL